MTKLKPISEVVACVVDNGQFISIARKVGEQVKKCYYWSPADKSFPTVADGIIGDGFPEMERVNSIWDVAKEVDLFIFPDIGMAGLQAELRRQGFAVWGSGEYAELESNRGLFLDTLKQLGMDVGKYERIVGVTALRDYLKDKTDKYIKVSKWRGNMETFHWCDWESGEAKLDYIASRFGAVKDLVAFYVFDPIDSEVEDGVDCYVVDGKYPTTVMHGVECKDKSYLGTICQWDDLPEEVRSVNEQFAPALDKCRSFFSTEVRITDNANYFIDPTLRAGSPPHQLMCELFANFADIIWHGANGILIEPIPTAKFGVQALLSITREKEEWVTICIPKEIDAHVKLGFCARLGDKTIFPPSPMENMVGYLAATGDTIQEAIDNLNELCCELPDGFKCENKSLAELLKEVHTAEDMGMEFTDETVPEPSAVTNET